MTISVLLADDHEPMRKAISNLLRSDPEIKLVGEAFGLRHAIELTSSLKPHIVVLDVHTDDESYVTPDEVKAHFGKSRLIAISFSHDDESKIAAKAFGAVAFLDKMRLATELIPTIKHYAVVSDPS